MDQPGTQRRLRNATEDRVAMTISYLKIPYILFELDIKPIERYILALTISYGGNMTASNNKLANMFHVSRRSIIDSINSLAERSYIDRDLNKNGRIISLASGEIIALLDFVSSEETAPLDDVSSADISISGEETAPNSIYSKYSYILRDKSQWKLPQEKLKQYEINFPDIDLHRELLKAAQWLLDNPAKQKTAKGMLRYLSGWLARAKPSATEMGIVETGPVDMDRANELAAIAYGEAS